MFYNINVSRYKLNLISDNLYVPHWWIQGRSGHNFLISLFFQENLGHKYRVSSAALLGIGALGRKF